MEAPMEAPNSTASVAHEAREGREHSRPVPGWSRPSPKVRWLLHHLSCQNDQVDGRGSCAAVRMPSVVHVDAVKPNGGRREQAGRPSWARGQGQAEETQHWSLHLLGQQPPLSDERSEERQ